MSYQPDQPGQWQPQQPQPGPPPYGQPQWGQQPQRSSDPSQYGQQQNGQAQWGQQPQYGQDQPAQNYASPPQNAQGYQNYQGYQGYQQPQYVVNVQNQYAVPGVEQKDWLTTLLLCIFLGGIGVHRFYTGHTAIGLIQLFTFGGCGIWALIDLIMIITGDFKDSNGYPLVKH